MTEIVLALLVLMVGFVLGSAAAIGFWTRT
jgi:hypothetical protein